MTSFPPEAFQLPQSLIENAKLLANREIMLELLPKHCVFSEVGVGLGDFTELVLECCRPTIFLAIDDFKLHEMDALWGRPVAELFPGGSHLDFYRHRFSREIEVGNLVTLCGDSAEQLASLEDGSVDVIYIDADHRYDYVKRDLEAAFKKVRSDGWIIMNDYIMVTELHADQFYGVVHATNEFMVDRQWGIQYFALQSRMFCDVALRPMHVLKGLRAHADAALAEAQELRSSTSWRVTEPIRRLSRALKRIARSTGLSA